jgi:hypothetical protein
MLASLVVVLIIGVGAVQSFAQAPVVQVFFDKYYLQQTKVCALGTIDSAYVVARNFNTYIVGIEYAVSYPAGISWLGDIPASDLKIGDTPSGISEVWSIPQNGFQPIKLATINYFCSMCNDDSPIVVTAHPVSGYLRATRYPDLQFIYAIGMTSVFCPVNIPVENTTWGKVKSLYE